MRVNWSELFNWKQNIALAYSEQGIMYCVRIPVSEIAPVYPYYLSMVALSYIENVRNLWGPTTSNDVKAYYIELIVKWNWKYNRANSIQINTLDGYWWFLHQKTS